MIYFDQKTAKSETYKPLNGIYISLKGGIVGFAIIATLIILTKLLSLSVNSAKSFNFDINDLVMSFWGFIILSFIIFAKENKNEEKN